MIGGRRSRTYLRVLTHFVLADILSVIQTFIYAFQAYEMGRSIQSAPEHFDDIRNDAESLTNDLRHYQEIFDRGEYRGSVRAEIKRHLDKANVLAHALETKLNKWKDKLDNGTAPSSPDEDDEGVNGASPTGEKYNRESTIPGRHVYYCYLECDHELFMRFAIDRSLRSPGSKTTVNCFDHI